MPKIPERWLDYKPLGLKVVGTRFIAFKAPLGKEFNNKLHASERFTPDILLQKCPTLKLVIDLTNTNRYYNKEEFTSQGIAYEKIMCPGQVIPPQPLIYRFFEIVDDFYLKNGLKEALIGIHCTHGVNRTGYFIGRYMVQRMGFHSEKAIQCIEEARGHKMERENFVKDLRVQQPIPSSLSSGKKTFNSKDNLSKSDSKTNGTVNKGKRKSSPGEKKSSREERRGPWANKGRESPPKKLPKIDDKINKMHSKEMDSSKQGKFKPGSSKDDDGNNRRSTSRGKTSRSAPSRSDGSHQAATSRERPSGGIPPRDRPPGGVPRGEPSLPTTQRGEPSGAVRHRNDQADRRHSGDAHQHWQQQHNLNDAGPSVSWNGWHGTQPDFSRNHAPQQPHHSGGDPRYWDNAPRSAAPFVPNNPPALSEFYEEASRGPRRSRSPARHLSPSRGRRSPGRRENSPSWDNRYRGQGLNPHYGRGEDRRSPYRAMSPRRASPAHQARMSPGRYQNRGSPSRGRPGRAISPHARIPSPRMPHARVSPDRIPPQRGMSPSVDYRMQVWNAPNSPPRAHGYGRLPSPPRKLYEKIPLAPNPTGAYNRPSTSRSQPHNRMSPGRVSPLGIQHHARIQPHNRMSPGRLSPVIVFPPRSRRSPSPRGPYRGASSPSRGSLMRGSPVRAQYGRMSPSRSGTGGGMVLMEARMTPPRIMHGRMSPSRIPPQQGRMSPGRRSPARRGFSPTRRIQMPHPNARDDQRRFPSPPRRGVSPSRGFSPRQFQRSLSPRRPASPMRRMGMSPQRAQSPWRRPASSPRRGISPVARGGSPYRRGPSPYRRAMSPPRHNIPPVVRIISPSRRGMSPSRRGMSPPRKGMSPPRRGMSPPRRGMSPPRRGMSPPRRGMSPPPRRAFSPPRRGMSPPRRGMSPPRRGMSPPRRGMSPPRRGVSPPRQALTPPRSGMSPSRRVLSPQRQPRSGLSLPRRGVSPGRDFSHPQHLGHDFAFEGSSAPAVAMGGENEVRGDCRDLLNQKRMIGDTGIASVSIRDVPREMDLRLIIGDVPPGSARARLGPQIKDRSSPPPRARSRSPRGSKPRGPPQPGPSRQRSPHSRFY